MDFVSLTPLEDDLLGPIGMESPSLMTTNRLIRTTSICTSMLLGAFYNERWFAAEWPLELTNECQKFRSSTPHADTFPWHSTRKSCANTPDHEQPITLYTFFLLNSLEKLPLLHNQYDITFLPFDLITLTSFIVFYRISSQSSDMKLRPISYRKVWSLRSLIWITTAVWRNINQVFAPSMGEKMLLLKLLMIYCPPESFNSAWSHLWIIDHYIPMNHLGNWIGTKDTALCLV